MAAKIYTLADFKGDSDLYGGSVTTTNRGQRIEIAVDTSDTTLIVRNIEESYDGFRKSTNSFTVSDMKPRELLELLDHIREGLQEVILMNKLLGKE